MLKICQIANNRVNCFTLYPGLFKNVLTFHPLRPEARDNAENIQCGLFLTPFSSRHNRSLKLGKQPNNNIDKQLLKEDKIFPFLKNCCFYLFLVFIIIIYVSFLLFSIFGRESRGQ